MMNKKYYKVLDRNGCSYHGGKMQYALPGRTGPGHNGVGNAEPLLVCHNGLHVTSRPWRWMKSYTSDAPDRWQDVRVFEVSEYCREIHANNLDDDKICVRIC